jgi:hypothetical protein
VIDLGGFAAVDSAFVGPRLWVPEILALRFRRPERASIFVRACADRGHTPRLRCAGSWFDILLAKTNDVP